MWRRWSLSPFSPSVPHRVCKVQKPICSQRMPGSAVDKLAPRSGCRVCGCWERVAGRGGRPRRLPNTASTGSALLRKENRQWTEGFMVYSTLRLVCTVVQLLRWSLFFQKKRSWLLNAAQFSLQFGLVISLWKSPSNRKSLGSGKKAKCIQKMMYFWFIFLVKSW